MKILFVIDAYFTHNNGTSISAQRFADELRKRGHEVKILGVGDKNTETLLSGTDKEARIPICQMEKKNNPRSGRMGGYHSLFPTFRDGSESQESGRPAGETCDRSIPRATSKYNIQSWDRQSGLGQQHAFQVI